MRRSAILLLALVSIWPVVASAATEDVTYGDDYKFTPSTVSLSVGDKVHWSKMVTSFSHNVDEEHGIFRSGDPTMQADDFTRTFSSGTFRYFCDNHVGLGMIGFVKVPPVTSRGPTGLPFTVRWANDATNTGSSWDVQYRIGSAKWRRWKSATTALKGVFGKNHKPVEVKKGKKYSFRTRSRDGASASRWSPLESFKP